MKKLSSMAAMAVAALALTACGGGGSGSLGFSGGSSSSSSGSGSGSGSGTGGGTTSTYSMGKGSGSSFQPGVIEISSTNVSAGGSTSLQVSIVDQTGTLYTGASVTVTFNSPCLSQGLASIAASGTSSAGTSPDTVTTSTGVAQATYTAKGCSGSDVITASATVSNASLTATGTVTVAAAATGSIQFESATPSTIGLKGTGTSTSTVVFKVLDSSGAPKPGVTVNFTLSTTVGGLTLSPASATSAADGTVQTVVSSGTVHTPVTVTAAISSPVLTTQSSVLTVSTGIPASSEFSISVGPAQYSGGNGPACANVEAYDIDGVVVPITVRLADRYSNPVLDGTAVSFFASGGHIDPQCDTSGGTGTCTVNWTSADPRPTPTSLEPYRSSAPGRVVILATAPGEESFTDKTGSGFYQPGDPFVNLGEAFDDANENGVYDSGEFFIDFNKNGQWDPGSGSFVGITCTGTSPGSTCTTHELETSASALLIMSTSGVVLSCVAENGAACSNPMSVAANAIVPITFNIQDGNGNPVAAGTTIAVSATSGTISSSSASFTVSCDGSPGGADYTTYFTAPASSGSGNIMIQATSPGTKTVSAPLVLPFTVP